MLSLTVGLFTQVRDLEPNGLLVRFPRIHSFYMLIRNTEQSTRQRRLIRILHFRTCFKVFLMKYLILTYLWIK